MKTTLLLALIAIGARCALFFLGYEVGAMDLIPMHLGALVIISYACGYFTLREDPETGFAELLRAGLRDIAIYAVIIAVFAWVFFTYINVHEFPDKVAEMVRSAKAQGISEAQARERATTFFTPTKYAFLTFMGLFAGGAVNALFFAYVHHRWLRKFKA
jgi:hypothetical protein